MLEPKPVQRPRPLVYAGGESATARALIATTCDAYVMHGDPPEVIAARVADMTSRRERAGGAALTFGVAGYAIVRDSAREAQLELARITDVKEGSPGYGNYQQWIANTQLERRVTLEDYSVSNRGLRSGLVGTPEQVRAQVAAFEAAGVNLLLLQCSPQLEEMERFAEQVIRPYRAATGARPPAQALPALPPGLAEGLASW